MVLGVCFFFFLIGYMSTYINSIDSKGNILNNKYMIMNQFCTQVGIDNHLRKKINKKLKYHTRNYYFSLFENNTILEDIPFPLRCEIAMNINNKVLQKFDFFQCLDESLLATITVYLLPISLSQSDIVYHRGDNPNESNLVFYHSLLFT